MELHLLYDGALVSAKVQIYAALHDPYQWPAEMTTSTQISKKTNGNYTYSDDSHSPTTSSGNYCIQFETKNVFCSILYTVIDGFLKITW